MRVPLVFFPALLALAITLGCSSGGSPPAVSPVPTLAAPAEAGPEVPAASAPAAPSVVETADPVPAGTVSLGAGNGLPVLEVSPEAVLPAVPPDSQRGILPVPDGVSASEPAVIYPGAGSPPLPAPDLSGTPSAAAPVPTLAASAAGGDFPLLSSAEILHAVFVSSAEAGSGHYELVLSSEAAEGPAGQALPFEVGIRMSGDFQLPDRESAIVTFDMGALSMRIEMVSVGRGGLRQGPAERRVDPGSPGFQSRARAGWPGRLSSPACRRTVGLPGSSLLVSMDTLDGKPVYRLSGEAGTGLLAGMSRGDVLPAGSASVSYWVGTGGFPGPPGAA